MKKRILLLRPSLQPPAGGSAVAAWMIEALRGIHEIIVVSWQPVDLAAINRYYGTSLQLSDMTLHRVPAAVARGIPRRGFEMWKYSYLLRQCRRLRAEYDVPIGVCNEADFGDPGIQYVHYPQLSGPRLTPRAIDSRAEVRLRWYRRSRLLMRVYFRLFGLGTGAQDRMRRNLTLTNSDWTAREVFKVHGITATTVYPPVPADFPTVPWDERANGFVCIGRIAPEKQLETIIAIVADVRRRGHDVHLRIIGAIHNPDYFDRIQRLQAEHSTWVRLDTNLAHNELATLVARHKYGIHAMQREHFGIGVAEMVNAGCIVFVPNDGGQVEIVGDRPELRYHSPGDAAEKIDRVLREPHRQPALREHLAARRSLFSTAEFTRRIRNIVEDFPA